MSKMIQKIGGLALIMIFCSFIVNSDTETLGVEIKKSITLVKDDIYQVTVKVTNGEKVNGIARYEMKLPITADFVKEVSRDKTINFRVDGRKLKMLWMHIQKNRSYTAVFQFKSKLSPDKLKMNGNFSVHEGGKMVTVSDTTGLLQY